MLRILSRLAKMLGLVNVHIVVVRQRRGAMRIIESSFPQDSGVDVRHIKPSMNPYANQA